mmetsp:Transcript_95033/g.212771  ORF Transcript_95033/g.212771 Transcript_95033/m.212771 type:complete len:262 (+) Transcript_95033:998-1783(+)
MLRSVMPRRWRTCWTRARRACGRTIARQKRRRRAGPGPRSSGPPWRRPTVIGTTSSSLRSSPRSSGKAEPGSTSTRGPRTLAAIPPTGRSAGYRRTPAAPRPTGRSAGSHRRPPQRHRGAMRASTAAVAAVRVTASSSRRSSGERSPAAAPPSRRAPTRRRGATPRRILAVLALARIPASRRCTCRRIAVGLPRSWQHAAARPPVRPWQRSGRRRICRRRASTCCNCAPTRGWSCSPSEVNDAGTWATVALPPPFPSSGGT